MGSNTGETWPNSTKTTCRMSGVDSACQEILLKVHYTVNTYRTKCSKKKSDIERNTYTRCKSH